MNYSSDVDTTPCPICRKALDGESDLELLQELLRNNRKLKNKVKFENARCSFYMRQHLKRKKGAQSAQKRLEEMETSSNRRLEQLEERYYQQIQKMKKEIKSLQKLIPVITID